MTDADNAQIRLGRALRSIRLSLGLSTRDVARRMGKKDSARTQIARWERAQVVLRTDQLLAYLSAIDVTLTDLDTELNPAPVTDLRLEEIAQHIQALG